MNVYTDVSASCHLHLKQRCIQYQVSLLYMREYLESLASVQLYAILCVQVVHSFNGGLTTFFSIQTFIYTRLCNSSSSIVISKNLQQKSHTLDCLEIEKKIIDHSYVIFRIPMYRVNFDSLKHLKIVLQDIIDVNVRQQGYSVFTKQLGVNIIERI